MSAPPTGPRIPDPPDLYLTVAGPAEVELKVKRSRFIGLARPAGSTAEARAHLADASRRFHDARHVCYGYRLGIGGDAETRRRDDGEPAGTAGEPILAAILGLDLSDTVVMVVRYFGGIKLGTGGLSRAYGQAAAEALAKAGTREVLLGRRFDLAFPYDLEKSLRRLLAAHRGRSLEQHYADRVTWTIWLPHSTWRTFAAALTEATAGTVGLVPAEGPETPPAPPST